MYIEVGGLVPIFWGRIPTGTIFLTYLCPPRHMRLKPSYTHSVFCREATPMSPSLNYNSKMLLKLCLCVSCSISYAVTCGCLLLWKKKIIKFLWQNKAVNWQHWKCKTYRANIIYFIGKQKHVIEIYKTICLESKDHHTSMDCRMTTDAQWIGDQSE